MNTDTIIIKYNKDAYTTGTRWQAALYWAQEDDKQGYGKTRSEALEDLQQLLNI